MSCATILPNIPSETSLVPCFALARIDGNICLAQIPPSTPGSTASALSTADVNIFVHEFINIFRFSHRATVHPADIHVIDSIGDDSFSCEEENERVFLSKDVMERFSKLTAHRPAKPIRSQPRMRYAPRSLARGRTPPTQVLSYPVR